MFWKFWAWCWRNTRVDNLESKVWILNNELRTLRIAHEHHVANEHVTIVAGPMKKKSGKKRKY